MLYKSLLAISLGFAACFSAQAQQSFGYTNGSFQRNDGVSVSTTVNHGLAFRISREKAAALKGSQIESVSLALSTRQVKDMSIFVAKEPGGTPIAETSITGAGTSVKEFKFDTPVTIDGTTELYVGYKLTANGTSYKPCLFDRTSDLPAGYVWGLGDGGWVDISQRGYGAPILTASISGTPESINDLLVKPVKLEGFRTAGKPYDYEVEVLNLGNMTIDEFDLVSSVGDGEPVRTKVSGISLAPASIYTFTLKDIVAQSSGTLNFNVTAENLGGTGGSDFDENDNTQSTSCFVYPEGVEKKVLIEEFTGQACSNCPDGYAAIAEALSSYPDAYVMVAHHAGYQPDAFSMQESAEYTFFYGSTSTYAPAAMADRAAYRDGLTSVVFGETGMTVASVSEKMDLRMKAEPYVSIALDNEYNADTRSGKLSVHVFTHVLPPAATPRLNVWMIQDGLQAYQSPVGQYTHNHVFRGALTDVWGDAIALEEGKTVTRTFDYTIPEQITSTYGGTYSFDAVPEDMQFVAFVGRSDSSPVDNEVFNVNSVCIAENVNSGISQPVVHPDGKSDIIYDLSGRVVKTPGKGVYIVGGKKVIF